jgi:hypothetical protein
MNMMAGRMQKQKLALGLNDGLIARSLSQKGIIGEESQSRGFSAPSRDTRTHHRLVHNVLIHGILGEPRTGDDEDFELVEIEMTEHGGVDLLVEAGVGLFGREVRRRKKERGEERRRRRENSPCLHREQSSRLSVSEASERRFVAE